MPVKGSHLVGSVPLPDSEAVFRQCTAGLPHRLRRIPDGETGSRNYFTFFQYLLFKSVPQLMVNFEDNVESQQKDFTQEQVDEGIAQLNKVGIHTGYDDAAIESYAVFKRLKDEGTIPKDVRFQVGLPSVASVISPFVQKAFQPQVYPIYEAALFRAMQNIQDKIPHEELSIQLDLAVDTAFWEGVYLEPWFKGESDVKEYVTSYLLRMIEQVDRDVELGIHNCYGDMEHKHWFEPTSLQAVVDRGLVLFEKSPHPIKYFHLPIPVSTMSNLESFLSPLKQLEPHLKAHDTEVYLGVVQYHDPEGTRQRIEAASKVLPEFGIASECGWGRTPAEQMEDIMKITRDLSEPVL